MNSVEETGGVSNSSAGRRVHRDTRDGPFTDAGLRGGRGRGRGRSRASGSVMDVVPGSVMKGLGGARSSSRTGLLPDSVQLQHDSGNESASPPSQHHHDQNSVAASSTFQGASRSQDEASRECNQRSSSKYNNVYINLVML